MKSIWKMFRVLLDKTLNILLKIKQLKIISDNMTAHQDNSINYNEIQKKFNKLKKNKNDVDINLYKKELKDFSIKFEKLSKKEKEEELNSKKFKQLCKDAKSLKDNDIIDIIDNMALSDFNRLSEKLNKLDDKIDILDNTLVDIRDRYILPQGKNIDDICNTTESINKDKKIDKIHADLSNSNKKLFETIKNIKPPIPQKIPNDYLKNDDFEFSIKEKLKDLKEIKESSENLETIPAKLNGIEKDMQTLSEKIDNLPSSNGAQTPKHIPKEEKSVIELAKYMTDGVAQFENIAKEYISKIGELEKLEKLKQQYQEELEKVKNNAFEDGKKDGQIELIKKLSDAFPTEFKEMQSIFEDFLDKKFKKDEKLEINDTNKNELMPFIKGSIENAKYSIISPAILLDGDILTKATVEKIDDNSEEG